MSYPPRALALGPAAALFATALNPRLPFTLQRRVIDAGSATNRLPAGTVARQLTLGGRPAERITVGASERPRAVLYLHGGGFVVGSARGYRSLAAFLARATGAVVFTLDYRLAPEHPYPAALEDAVAAFEQLVADHGFAPGRVAIAGDSAGGGLAVATARRLLDRGVGPAALALLSPWTDPGDESISGRDMVVNAAWGRLASQAYRGGCAVDDPGFAPIHGRLDDLPPTLVHVAESEILRPQVERFAARAADAGVEVRLQVLPRFCHSGHVLAGSLRSAAEAVTDVGAFLLTELDREASLTAATASAATASVNGGSATPVPAGSGASA